ncbi:unnamed protein product, partial [Urochloa humidicola]
FASVCSSLLRVSGGSPLGFWIVGNREARGGAAREGQRRGMALTNFILTVVGVGAAVMLLRKDVKQSATMFRRNVRHIRNWLEEESAAAAKSTEGSSVKELESQAAKKDSAPKADKH